MSKKKTTFDSQIIVPKKAWKTGENQLHIKIVKYSNYPSQVGYLQQLLPNTTLNGQ